MSPGVGAIVSHQLDGMDRFDEMGWAQSLLLCALETPLAFTSAPRSHSYNQPEGYSDSNQTSHP